MLIDQLVRRTRRRRGNMSPDSPTQDLQAELGHQRTENGTLATKFAPRLGDRRPLSSPGPRSARAPRRRGDGDSLAHEVPVTRQAFTKHLGVLEHAGLVTRHREDEKCASASTRTAWTTRAAPWLGWPRSGTDGWRPSSGSPKPRTERRRTATNDGDDTIAHCGHAALRGGPSPLPEIRRTREGQDCVARSVRSNEPSDVFARATTLSKQVMRGRDGIQRLDHGDGQLELSIVE
jgi:hypothetical protein